MTAMGVMTNLVVNPQTSYTHDCSEVLPFSGSRCALNAAVCFATDISGRRNEKTCVKASIVYTMRCLLFFKWSESDEPRTNWTVGELGSLGSAGHLRNGRSHLCHHAVKTSHGFQSGCKVTYPDSKLSGMITPVRCMCYYLDSPAD